MDVQRHTYSKGTSEKILGYGTGSKCSLILSSPFHSETLAKSAQLSANRNQNPHSSHKKKKLIKKDAKKKSKTKKSKNGISKSVSLTLSTGNYRRVKPFKLGHKFPIFPMAHSTPPRSTETGPLSSNAFFKNSKKTSLLDSKTGKHVVDKSRSAKGKSISTRSVHRSSSKPLHNIFRKFEESTNPFGPNRKPNFSGIMFPRTSQNTVHVPKDSRKRRSQQLSENLRKAYATSTRGHVPGGVWRGSTLRPRALLREPSVVILRKPREIKLVTPKPPVTKVTPPLKATWRSPQAPKIAARTVDKKTTSVDSVQQQVLASVDPEILKSFRKKFRNIRIELETANKVMYLSSYECTNTSDDVDADDEGDAKRAEIRKTLDVIHDLQNWVNDCISKLDELASIITRSKSKPADSQSFVEQTNKEYKVAIKDLVQFFDSLPSCIHLDNYQKLFKAASQPKISSAPPEATRPKSSKPKSAPLKSVKGVFSVSSSDSDSDHTVVSSDSSLSRSVESSTSEERFEAVGDVEVEEHRIVLQSSHESKFNFVKSGAVSPKKVPSDDGFVDILKVKEHRPPPVEEPLDASTEKSRKQQRNRKKSTKHSENSTKQSRKGNSGKNQKRLKDIPAGKTLETSSSRCEIVLPMTPSPSTSSQRPTKKESKYRNSLFFTKSKESDTFSTYQNANGQKQQCCCKGSKCLCHPQVITGGGRPMSNLSQAAQVQWMQAKARQMRKRDSFTCYDMLDELSLKDLTPLKAEYPRKDFFQPPHYLRAQNTFLYSVVYNRAIHKGVKELLWVQKERPQGGGEFMGDLDLTSNLKRKKGKFAIAGSGKSVAKRNAFSFGSNITVLPVLVWSVGPGKVWEDLQWGLSKGKYASKLDRYIYAEEKRFVRASGIDSNWIWRKWNVALSLAPYIYILGQETGGKCAKIQEEGVEIGSKGARSLYSVAKNEKVSSTPNLDYYIHLEDNVKFSRVFFDVSTTEEGVNLERIFDRKNVLKTCFGDVENVRLRQKLAYYIFLVENATFSSPYGIFARQEYIAMPVQMSYDIHGLSVKKSPSDFSRSKLGFCMHELHQGANLLCNCSNHYVPSFPVNAVVVKGQKPQNMRTNSHTALQKRPHSCRGSSPRANNLGAPVDKSRDTREVSSDVSVVSSSVSVQLGAKAKFVPLCRRCERTLGGFKGKYGPQKEKPRSQISLPPSQIMGASHKMNCSSEMIVKSHRTPNPRKVRTNSPQKSTKPTNPSPAPPKPPSPRPYDKSKHVKATTVNKVSIWNPRKMAEGTGKASKTTSPRKAAEKTPQKPEHASNPGSPRKYKPRAQQQTTEVPERKNASKNIISKADGCSGPEADRNRSIFMDSLKGEVFLEDLKRIIENTDVSQPEMRVVKAYLKEVVEVLETRLFFSFSMSERDRMAEYMNIEQEILDVLKIVYPYYSPEKERDENMKKTKKTSSHILLEKLHSILSSASSVSSIASPENGTGNMCTINLDSLPEEEVGREEELPAQVNTTRCDVSLASVPVKNDVTEANDSLEFDTNSCGVAGAKGDLIPKEHLIETNGGDTKCESGGDYLSEMTFDSPHTDANQGGPETIDQSTLEFTLTSAEIDINDSKLNRECLQAIKAFDLEDESPKNAGDAPETTLDERCYETAHENGLNQQIETAEMLHDSGDESYNVVDVFLPRKEQSFKRFSDVQDSLREEDSLVRSEMSSLHFLTSQSFETFDEMFWDNNTGDDVSNSLHVQDQTIPDSWDSSEPLELASTVDNFTPYEDRTNYVTILGDIPELNEYEMLDTSTQTSKVLLQLQIVEEKPPETRPEPEKYSVQTGTSTLAIEAPPCEKEQLTGVDVNTMTSPCVISDIFSPEMTEALPEPAAKRVDVYTLCEQEQRMSTDANTMTNLCIAPDDECADRAETSPENVVKGVDVYTVCEQEQWMGVDVDTMTSLCIIPDDGRAKNTETCGDNEAHPNVDVCTMTIEEFHGNFRAESRSEILFKVSKLPGEHSDDNDEVLKMLLLADMYGMNLGDYLKDSDETERRDTASESLCETCTQMPKIFDACNENHFDKAFDEDLNDSGGQTTCTVLENEEEALLSSKTSKQTESFDWDEVSEDITDTIASIFDENWESPEQIKLAGEEQLKADMKQNPNVLTDSSTLDKNTLDSIDEVYSENCRENEDLGNAVVATASAHKILTFLDKLSTIEDDMSVSLRLHVTLRRNEKVPVLETALIYYQISYYYRARIHEPRRLVLKRLKPKEKSKHTTFAAIGINTEDPVWNFGDTVQRDYAPKVPENTDEVGDKVVSLYCPRQTWHPAEDNAEISIPEKNVLHRKTLKIQNGCRTDKWLLFFYTFLFAFIYLQFLMGHYRCE